ncbi:type I restriction enzyme endonuclease domain-containing protein [Geodermatophilus sp. SYSU D00710]
MRRQRSLREDEPAFSDAVCRSGSAVLELGDDTLTRIAAELVSVVRVNTTVDWDRREQVWALLRSRVRRLLTRYRYPLDKQETGIALVMQQAELLATEVAA